MKKLISLTISFCLVFGLVLPVFGATIEDYSSFTSPSAISYDQYHIKEDQLGNYQETRADAVSDSGTHTLLNDLIRVFTGSGGTMYNSISELESWLTPVGSFNTSHSITGVTLYEIVDYIAWTLSGQGATVYDLVNSISSMVSYLPSIDSRIGTANNLLTATRNAVYNYSAENMNYGTWTWANASKYAHTQLLGNDPFGTTWNGAYKVSWIADNGTISLRNYRWDYGSPIGNVALLTDTVNNNLVNAYGDFRNKFLTHYNDQLSTWDSQGDTLDQVLFTPDSGLQALYRYLAFTQRDVARLTYVFASDEELAVREKARENQDAVLDNFIDPDGSGSVADSDFGDIADASSQFKDNFDTGADASDIFNIFDEDDHATPWFSNETKNELMPQTRSEYNTPLLDDYYSDVLKYLGGDQK